MIKVVYEVKYVFFSAVGSVALTDMDCQVIQLRSLWCAVESSSTSSRVKN